MKELGLIIGFMVLVCAFGVYLLATCTDNSCLIFEWQRERAANSFERCQELGFPVMESYPRQCRAGDKTFVEEVESLPDGGDDVSDVIIPNKNISVVAPAPNTLVTSPVTVTGEARGTWYFEASFPVMVVDSDGNKLGVVPAQAEGDWMTTDFVPFSVTIPFESTTASVGSIVLLKDNPSGLPENDDSISIPVRFK